MDQFVRLKGFVQQRVQAGTVTRQEVIGGALAAHGDSGNSQARGGPARGWGLREQQVQSKPVGQLQIDQQQVVVALSQEGTRPSQAVGLLDHTTGPGILQDDAGTEPVHGLIINNEYTRSGRQGHDEVPTRWCCAMTPLPAGAGNPVFWVVIAIGLKCRPTEERCSLHTVDAGEARIFIQLRSPTVDVR